MSVNCLRRSEKAGISLGAGREDGMRMSRRDNLIHKQNPKLGSEIGSTMYSRNTGRTGNKEMRGFKMCINS